MILTRNRRLRIAIEERLHFTVLLAFDGEGYGVAAAEAERGDTALEVAALQLI